ncbi:LysR substrate-binding domain-containing protein [Aquabacterium sp.]|uniref:LysR substrate-binding domain-containing protein n=1 Tax=Aquabacterium sp. TaxID=1872578 RepID=UPI0035B01F75
MDLRALRYFVETVRQQSFTQAAVSLCVTQSTISKMVRQLEDEMGQPLLIREGRQVRLTDAGQIVFARGQEALALVHQLQREVSDLASLSRGELTVGLPPTVNVLFSPLVRHFKERYPQIELSIREAGGQVVEQLVASGELEVGVSVLPVDPALGLETAVLGRYPVCLVGPKDVAWADRPRLGLQVLHQQPVVMLSDDYALTRQLRAAFQKANVMPHMVAQSGQWDFLLSLVQAGMGTALLPEPVLQRAHLGDDIVVRPLHDTAAVWTIAMVWAHDRYLSHAARAWLDVCRDFSSPAPSAGRLPAAVAPDTAPGSGRNP